MERQSCDRSGWLLEFCVCWDAAVCTGRVGGFFYVLHGVSGVRSVGLKSLEFFRA
jgi:hypothetical protein